MKFAKVIAPCQNDGGVGGGRGGTDIYAIVE